MEKVSVITQLAEALENIAPMSRCSMHRLDRKDGHDKGIGAESPTCGHCSLGRQVRAALDRARAEPEESK